MSIFYNKSNFTKLFKKNVKCLEFFFHNMKEQFPSEFSKINGLKQDIDPHFLMLIYAFSYLKTEIDQKIEENNNLIPKKLLYLSMPLILKQKPSRLLLNIDINNTSANDIIFIKSGTSLLAKHSYNTEDFKFLTIEDVNIIKFKTFTFNIVEISFFSKEIEKNLIKHNEYKKFLRIVLEVNNLSNIANKEVNFNIETYDGIKSLQIFSEQQNDIYFRTDDVLLQKLVKSDYLFLNKSKNLNMQNHYLSDKRYLPICYLFMFKTFFTNFKIKIPKIFNTSKSKIIEIFIPTILDTVDSNFLTINTVNVINLFYSKTKPINLQDLIHKEINLFPENKNEKIYSFNKSFISNDENNFEIPDLYFNVNVENNNDINKDMFWAESIDDQNNVQIEIYGNIKKDNYVIYSDVTCFNDNLDEEKINNITFIPLIPSSRIKIKSYQTTMKDFKITYDRIFGLINSNIRHSLRCKKGIILLKDIFSKLGDFFNVSCYQIESISEIFISDYTETIFDGTFITNLLGENIDIILKEESNFEFYIALTDFLSSSRNINCPVKINIFDKYKNLIFQKKFGFICRK